MLLAKTKRVVAESVRLGVKFRLSVAFGDVLAAEPNEAGMMANALSWGVIRKES